MSANESGDAEKKEDKTLLDVHSANSWETADLGDKSRNEKFLRLMGAAKKEHHGRFVIGDQEGKHRDKPDEKHRADELEEQYNHSLEHTLAGGKKSHIGLGFHDEDAAKQKEQGDSDNDKKVEKGDADSDKKVEKGDDAESTEKSDSDIKGGDGSEEKKEGSDRKRESLNESGPEHEEVKKMKFVKSSS